MRIPGSAERPARIPDLAHAGENEIGLVAASVRAGEVVALLTETLWGLSGDPYSPSAMARVAALKGRSPARGFLCLVPAVDAGGALGAETGARRSFSGRGARPPRAAGSRRWRCASRPPSRCGVSCSRPVPSLPRARTSKERSRPRLPTRSTERSAPESPGSSGIAVQRMHAPRRLSTRRWRPRGSFAAGPVIPRRLISSSRSAVIQRLCEIRCEFPRGKPPRRFRGAALPVLHWNQCTTGRSEGVWYLSGMRLA